MVAKQLKKREDGCWKAYTNDSWATKPKYYPGEISRDAARYAMAKSLGVNKGEIRAQRYKE